MLAKKNTIGVVGGMGPYAGLDLTRKIFDETWADADGEHLPVALLSFPHGIADRSEYILGRSTVNPAQAIFEVVLELARLEVSVVGMPCNTAHAPQIFGEVRRLVGAAGLRLQVLHMIEEVARHLIEQGQQPRRLGLLATRGTYAANTYQAVLEPLGFEVIIPDEAGQERVHAAIYDPGYGIKTFSNPVSETAQRELQSVAQDLRRSGAEAIIAGCTEVPLALGAEEVEGLPLIDATRILARALVREAAPAKLKPLVTTAT